MPLNRERIELIGPILGGRDSAFKENLLARLAALPAAGLLVLDCSQVQFMDYSWADEVVAGLLEAAHQAETRRFVVVYDPNPNVSESIAAAMSLHGLTCAQVDEAGQTTVLGGLSPALLQTYNLAVAQDQISAQDLPGHLSPSTKSNRLRELEQRGLLYRVGEEIIEGGGRRFIYEPVR